MFRSRYSVLFAFIVTFIILSFAVRTLFVFLTLHKAGLSPFTLAAVYLKGFLYDLAVAVYLTAAYALYLLLLPQRWNNSKGNRIITYGGCFLMLLIVMFSLFAEITFWREFESRFNFIAVDYLVYTFEVVSNINQSYPLPYLIGGMLLVSLLVVGLFQRKRVFAAAFASATPFRSRALVTGGIIATACLFSFFLSNTWAEKGSNRYSNELAKAGIFSFFAAFSGNELDYHAFYLKENDAEAFSRARNVLAEPQARFTGGPYSIRRLITDSGEAQRPNVIMITIESLSASFLGSFGNRQHLTPVLDSLAKEGMVFTDMYATGTRTVRGMEALTLSVPPTPGNSIVRRHDNEDLFTVGTVFRQAGYARTFFYGGDGYFDNMNAFFGGNGFNITDRTRKLLPGENKHTVRTSIADSQVHFENAWGICDEDLYDAVIRDADRQQSLHQPFFDFVMTTSNHRPFTYPAGKIDIPSGSGREGAVKYTDYAIGQLIRKMQDRPWFPNTVVIFVADHCASSAGKDQIDVEKYHIPCIVYNLKARHPSTLNVQCSQIDLYPTLFGLLHWRYQSDFYGQNITLPGYHPRALMGTYQELGYLQHDSLVVLSPRQLATTSRWNRNNDGQTAMPADSSLLHKAIAAYQTAYYLYKHGRMKEKPE